MTQNPTGWQSAHSVAVQAMAIVVEHKPVKRAWPFTVQVVDFRGDALGHVGIGGAAAMAGGASEAAPGHGGAALSAIPCGNYGDNLPKASVGGKSE